MARLPVKKTYKLFIGGAFPRSESGRTYEAQGQNVARASRKDARDAVSAARAAQPKWAGATAYNRGQVLYRIAEMIEARTAEFAELVAGPRRGRAGDRPLGLVRGLRRQARAGARLVEPGRRARTSTSPCPSRPASSRSSRRRSRRCSASSRGSRRRSSAAMPSSRSPREASPLAAVELAEALATSDLPGRRRQPAHRPRAELAPWLASHMDVNAIDLTGADGLRTDLERAAAENVKRVVTGRRRRAEPLRDLGLPRAEDDLAPDRRLALEGRDPRLGRRGHDPAARLRLPRLRRGAREGRAVRAHRARASSSTAPTC